MHFVVFEKFPSAYFFQNAGEKSGDYMSNGNCLKMFDILCLCLIELLRLFLPVTLNYTPDLELQPWYFALFCNGNRTEWSPIRSVIIRVINKIGRPCSGSPICLITSMITDRI